MYVRACEFEYILVHVGVCDFGYEFVYVHVSMNFDMTLCLYVHMHLLFICVGMCILIWI